MTDRHEMLEGWKGEVDKLVEGIMEGGGNEVLTELVECRVKEETRSESGRKVKGGRGWK